MSRSDFELNAMSMALIVSRGGSQQLQAGHVGAGPANAGQRPTRQRRAEAIGKETEQEMPDDGQPHAERLNSFQIDPVGQCHKKRNCQHVGAVERYGDPTGRAITQRPLGCKLWQLSWPEEGTNLTKHLRNSDQQHELPSRTVLVLALLDH